MDFISDEDSKIFLLEFLTRGFELMTLFNDFCLCVIELLNLES